MSVKCVSYTILCVRVVLNSILVCLNKLSLFIRHRILLYSLIRLSTEAVTSLSILPSQFYTVYNILYSLYNIEEYTDVIRIYQNQ